ncbi:hypothetical protein DOP62_14125 (plasmid) [Synechococcus elongatus PCC 11801]|uniref:Uncharacterized protein n=1 Tax=Synechococcus elongatus PCC 11801 TaxID=2219813 RepID=A0ACD5A2Y9_SYNEL
MTDIQSDEMKKELQTLIDMAKDRVGDVLSDSEIEEVAKSVFEELLMRGEYSHLEADGKKIKRNWE